MMAEFAKWMIGAVLVAAGAVSLGYGSGMMWRAWNAATAINQSLADQSVSNGTRGGEA